MKSKTVLLSMDTSVRNTGYAIYENGKLKKYGNLSVKKEGRSSVDTMIRQISKLLDNTNPDIVVVENTVVLRNAKIQRDLTMIVGGIKFWTIYRSKFFYTMNPTEWRKLVRDSDEVVPKHRAELKQWSISKANEFTSEKINDDNISDAILIGKAYINQFRG